jgi:hypothetical protein
MNRGEAGADAVLCCVVCCGWCDLIADRWGHGMDDRRGRVCTMFTSTSSRSAVAGVKRWLIDDGRRWTLRG